MLCSRQNAACPAAIASNVMADGCFGACPEGAIIKLGPGKRYRFDFELCTGCAVCFEQCPCHAIEMIDEPAAGKAQTQ